jgi:drug/metabolite transporter (DMT)-like permease
MSVPKRVYLFLIVGLLAASQSANIIRLGEAHAVAIAAWRLGIAAVLLFPLASAHLGAVKRLGRLNRLLLVLAGVVLSVHFITWIGAVQHTTVVNASVFFSINPLLTSLAAHLLFRERLGARLFLSIGLGLAGVAILGGHDFSLRSEHLFGDGLALLCAVLFTIYLLLGKRLRPSLPTSVYVFAVYGVAAAVSFACLGLIGRPFFRYNSVTWLCFFLMALLPTMIGHTSFNQAVRYIDAGRISAATLSEPLLAGVVAYFAWGEAITWQMVVGYLFISASVLVLVLDRSKPVLVEEGEAA